MVLIAHEYGSISMGSVERIKDVARHVAKQHRAGHQIMVVPSAMSDETNRLLDMTEETSAQPDLHELDMIASTGEQVSVGLLAIALHTEGINARSCTGWQVPVRTNSAYTKAHIQSIDDERVRADLDTGCVIVIAGFQGIDSEDHITILDRSSPDTSAMTVTAALEAEECLIYTNTNGVYMTDPRVVDGAHRLDKITFEETLEMASLGSRVLQVRSVGFAGKYRVKTRVLSSLTDPLMPLDVEISSGTLVTFEENSNMEAAAIPGIAFARDEARITMIGVPDRPDITYQILGPATNANVDVDMIIQNQSVEGKTDFTFTVPRGEYQHALAILNNSVKAHIGAVSVSGDPKVSKMPVMGVGTCSHVGITSRMFRTLLEEGINIQMISTSEIKILVLIGEKYMELVMRALHEAFKLDQA